MDLRSRLEMAGRALLALLDPGRDLMPTGGYEVAHDLGRWWDAVLRLEEAIGFVIPAELEAASLRNLQKLTDNPDRLLMNSPDVPWLREKVKLNPHNFRETLLAFGGLVRCRDSLWAREAGLHLVRAMDRSLQPDGRFDFAKLGSWGHVPHTQDPSHTEGRRDDGWFDGTATSGRCLEALVWFYEATGDPLVLDVARQIAEHHMAFTVSPDGTVRDEIVSPDNIGHNHSYHGTLRGLLLYGLLTGQSEYAEVVEATYRNAVQNRIVMESGWTPHDLGKTRFPNEHGDPVTDPASTGDAAQLALWLALRAGAHDLLDDVDRYVRARLLPAQLTQDDVRLHPEREFAPRQIGAWSIHGPSHGGKGCTPDVLAAVTHSLCDIYRNICTQAEAGLRLNLHLDYEDDDVRVAADRSREGELSVTVKRPVDVALRIPGWTPRATVRFTVDGEPKTLQSQGVSGGVPAGLLRSGSEVVMRYGLPTRTTRETMPSGRCYRFRWRGDEITGIAPVDAPIPFYPALQGEPE